MIYEVYTDCTFLVEANHADAAHELVNDVLAELDHPQFISEPDVGVLAVEPRSAGSI